MNKQELIEFALNYTRKGCPIKVCHIVSDFIRITNSLEQDVKTWKQVAGNYQIDLMSALEKIKKLESSNA